MQVPRVLLGGLDFRLPGLQSSEITMEGRKEGRKEGGWVGPFESFAFAARVTTTTTIIIMVHSYCKATSKVKRLAQVVL